MGKLSNSAVIVIVIVCCLAFISLGAALTRQLYPPSRYEGGRFEPSREQELYMRSVRIRTRGVFRQESLMGKDLESNCECFEFRWDDGGDVWSVPY